MMDFTMNARKFAVLAIVQSFILIACVWNNTDILLFLALSLWLYFFVFLSGRLYENVELIVFLICFFVFLLNGQVASQFLGYEYSTAFSTEIENHTNFVIIISLIFIILGFSITRRLSGNIKAAYYENTETTESAEYKSVRQLSRLAFYFTAIFWYILIIEQGRYTQANGYYALYSEYTSNMPYLVKVLAEFAPISFYIFLATRPSKRECRLPFLIYLVYLGISLMTGRRIYIAVGLLFLATYIIIRDRESKEKWIDRKWVWLACGMIPVFIIFLQIYGQIRLGNSSDDSGAIQTIINFIGGQGYTVNIIKYEQLYSNELGEDKWYSLYNLIRFLRTSRLTSWLMPAYNFKYGTYTVANAVNGNSFANSLTYIIAPNTFLKGGGTGSCYIAELFHDFGYVGVVVGNFLYGVLFAKLSSMRNKGILWMAVGFVILECMFKVPRYNFDYILSELLDVTNLIYLLFFALFAQKIRAHSVSEKKM